MCPNWGNIPVETMKSPRRQIMNKARRPGWERSSQPGQATTCTLFCRLGSTQAGQSKEKQAFSLLSCHTKSILLGSLLGDGSLKINKGYKNARFSFRHSIKQKEYFLFKRNILHKSISAPKDMWEQTQGTDWQPHKLRYQSRALVSLSYLYHITHKGSSSGKIRIRRTWLNLMDAQALAIWWCDDGSLVANTKQGVFCTDGFSYQDVKILDAYMKKVWGISTAVHPVGKGRTGHYRLWIRSVTDLKIFLRIIMPHIPVFSMLYKVLILYKDSGLQQRWISEIADNTAFARADIERLAAERKSKLAAFQKMI